MRTIKFRAWDKKDKIMLNLLLWDWRPHPPENIIPMQYTGLKDKNGKEIYEGDILGGGAVVEWFDRLTWDSGGSEHSGFYCRRWFDLGEEGELNYDSGFDFCEVIGNIYENPDLLNRPPTEGDE